MHTITPMGEWWIINGKIHDANADVSGIGHAEVAAKHLATIIADMMDQDPVCSQWSDIVRTYSTDFIMAKEGWVIV